MRTMTRRKKDNRMAQANDERLLPVEETLVEDHPKPRAFAAPPCSKCTAMRPRGTNFSRVYSVHGSVRYIKCDYCGNTFKCSENS